MLLFFKYNFNFLLIYDTDPQKLLSTNCKVKIEAVDPLQFWWTKGSVLCDLFGELSFLKSTELQRWGMKKAAFHFLAFSNWKRFHGKYESSILDILNYLCSQNKLD